MRLQSLMSGLLVASVGLASVLKVDIYTDGDEPEAINAGDRRHKQAVLPAPGKQDDQPSWRKRDNAHYVPLHPGARTGVLSPEVEEGLIYALGPYFANEFIEAAHQQSLGNVTDAAARCNPFSCAGAIIKATPCMLAAIKCKCIDPLLKCPVPPSKICDCVACLPKDLRDFIEKIGLCKGNFDDVPSLPADDGAGTSYPELIEYAQRDSNLLAFRGDIRNAQIQEAREIAAAGICPGKQCGDCPCCLGVCILSKCIGVCLPLPETSGHRTIDEL